jgi:hypothetical protein
MKKILQSLCGIAILLALATGSAFAQGSTSSAINGKVKGSDGEELIGATVIAVHVPTGTEYGSVTNTAGNYIFPNVRVGGPYTVKVSYVGYETKIVEGINLALGEKRNIDFVIAEETETLQEIVVKAQSGEVINSGRTGASTNISTETINNNPSINRSIEDFSRLTPQAASGVGNGGTSIAGSNSRSNNITIDGAINNDAFGLNANGLPGSSAGAEPISLDAIQELTVLVAPYDVTKGSFTGGGINAVTRSGTNEFEGSAYFFNRNEQLAGKTLGENPQQQAPFFNRQYGARLGGPIVKDKIFFFVNAEQQVAESPFQINLVNQSELDSYGNDVPANISRISIEEAQSVRQHLLNNYDYDPGSFGPLSPRTMNNKLFGKIDWNINENHQLTLRHSYLKATDENIGRSQNTLQFTNNGYLNDVTSNSTIAELRSRFGTNMSNNLIIGYTQINRERNLDDYGPLFPHIDIIQPNNTVIRAGSQRSSVGNELRQGIGQLTNNFSIFKDRHTITFGTHNEFFNIYNSFVNRYNGHYEYRGIDNFLNNTFAGDRNNRFRVAYSLDYFNDRFQAVDLNFLQTGFYVQDEWDVNDNFRLTGGLRVDIPFFLDKPSYNSLLDQEIGRDNTNLPDGQLLWSPRVGFNFDIKGDKSMQLRGGVGIFTGRVPFVWISNAYTNAGATLSLADQRGNVGDVPLFPDGNRTYEYYIADQLGVGVDDPAVRAEILSRQQNAPRSQVDLIDNNLKLPQNLRANLAFDAKLPWGMTGTVEAIYTKAVNAMYYQNLQNPEPTGTIPGEENRPTFATSRTNPNFNDIYLITNTNKGYQYSFTGQLNKAWNNNFSAMAAYTYGVAKDVNGGTHTTANSGWEFNPTPGSPNEPILSFSVWDLRHRIVSNLNYTLDYSDFTSTTFGVFLSAQSGSPFTYLVNGDLNGDGAFGNDQAYVPANQSEILFGDFDPNAGDIDPDTGEPEGAIVQFDQATQNQMYSELNAFIERDDYLKDNRGQIAERNAARTPWTALVDLRFMQEFKIKAGGKNNRLQLTLDIENFANFLNRDWGKQYFVQFNTYNLLNYEGRDSVTGRPLYTYSDQDNPFQINNNRSIWRMQFGLRYIFGN